MFLQWSAALQDRSNKTVFDCGGMIWLWLSLVSEPPECGDSSSLVEKEQRVPGSSLSRLWNRSLYDWPAFDGWLVHGITTSPPLLQLNSQGQREQARSIVIPVLRDEVFLKLYQLSSDFWRIYISVTHEDNCIIYWAFINLQEHFLSFYSWGALE